MFEELQDKRIRVRLDSLGGTLPRLARVEDRTRAFTGYISNIMRILEQSSLGRALLQSARENGVSVGLDALLEPSNSFFYPTQNHIDLGYQPDLLQKTEKGLSRYLVSFTGALRRAWHHHEGFALDLSLEPRAFLEQFRMAEADAEAVIMQVAWELRAQGAAFLWRHLLSGHNGDMALVFERTVLENPRHSFDGSALKSAFNQWFAERERTAEADHLALETIDMMLVHPECHAMLGTQSFRREEMQLTGQLPNGRNYLAGCLFTSLWYQGPDSEINRIHLQHIESDLKKIARNQQHIS